MAEGRMTEPNLKKLKRMPHIFSQILELPVAGDAPVESEETEESFRFVVEDPELVACDILRVEVVGIVPGAKKVVLRGLQGPSVSGSDEPETWRFRLPPSANPDATWARFEDGVLTVVVPKTQSHKDDNVPGEGVFEEFKGYVVSGIKGARPISVF